MDANVIVAIVGASASLLGSFFGIVASSKMTTYRISQLEEKVNKHNNIIERVYHLEQTNAIQDEKIAVANHRIEDLEKVVSR